MEEMKLYIGTKVIRAAACTEFDFRRGKGQTPADTEIDRDGYLVLYPDGYQSWSPKETFETAYRLITESEKTMKTHNFDITKWFTWYWYAYLIEKPINWTKFWCRIGGHKCGIIYYSNGIEPDNRCKNCYDEIF